MTINDFIKNLKDKWETIFIITILSATFGLYINFVLPHYYKASSEYLIVQKQNANIDAYTAIKGSEQLAYTYKQIIYSPVFFNQVVNSNRNINQDYFGDIQTKIIKKWHKTVVPETVANTGILKIDIYHPNQKQATNISRAISYVIQHNQNLFLGNNNEIQTIVLSASIVSDKYVKPKALINTLLGLIIGLIGSVGFIVMFPQKALKKLTVDYKKNIATNKVVQKNFPVTIKKSSAPSNLPIL